MPVTAYHFDMQQFFRIIFQTRVLISQDTRLPAETWVMALGICWTLSLHQASTRDSRGDGGLTGTEAAIHG